MSTPPPPPPQGPWPPPPPPPPGDSTALIIGLAFAGMFAYSIVNGIMAFFMFFAAMSGGGNTFVLIAAIALGVFGLGGGIALICVRRPWTKGLGLGLMIGWALWSLLTAGMCTGLNPSAYS